MGFNATYSPDDNKLRLYASARLDPELYQRVRAAGFIWAPKQELFVAPMWTPSREDLLIELAGEVEDEDKSLVERAEERAERFENLSVKRAGEAEGARKAVSAIADNIPFGQPILIGHHSEKRARKDAEKIRSGMDRAVKLWKESTYWTDRAAGSLRAAKYKELPQVRARRIKKLEAELRKCQKNRKDTEISLALWRKIAAEADPEKQTKQALCVANFEGYSSFKFSLADYPRDPPASQYEGEKSLWSAMTDGIITGAQAAALAIPGKENYLPRNARWIEHYENRLAYERAMLGEQGGTVADQTKPQKGGAVQSLWAPRGGWAYIQKVNKVTVTILHKWSGSGRVFKQNVPLDKLRGVMSPIAVDEAKAAGRLIEVEDGIGFMLRDAAPPDAPKPAEPKPDGAAFEAMQQSLKAGVQVVVANQLFATPKGVGALMAEAADLQPGDKVLEPSAGTGRLLGALGGQMFGHNPERGSVVAVEINRKLADVLSRDFPLTTVVCGDFLEQRHALGKFDKIVMNPPFENAIDIKHIEAAAEMLEPGGRLVALCANGPRQRERLIPLASEWRELDPGSFKEAGTNVNVMMLVIEA